MGAGTQGMGSQSVETARKLRADAVRNRERVLAAAKAVFSAGGAEASLEAVARRAGVGIGTLYRHFPTREALYEAVYRHEVQQLWELAERLKDEASPVEALRRGMRAIVEFVATKKGMSAALALAVTGFSEPSARPRGSRKQPASCWSGLLPQARYAPVSTRRSDASGRRHVPRAQSAGMAGERPALGGRAR